MLRAERLLVALRSPLEFELLGIADLVNEPWCSTEPRGELHSEVAGVDGVRTRDSQPARNLRDRLPERLRRLSFHGELLRARYSYSEERVKRASPAKQHRGGSAPTPPDDPLPPYRIRLEAGSLRPERFQS